MKDNTRVCTIVTDFWIATAVAIIALAIGIAADMDLVRGIGIGILGTIGFLTLISLPR